MLNLLDLKKLFIDFALNQRKIMSFDTIRRFLIFLRYIFSFSAVFLLKNLNVEIEAAAQHSMHMYHKPV